MTALHQKAKSHLRRLVWHSIRYRIAATAVVAHIFAVLIQAALGTEQRFLFGWWIMAALAIIGYYRYTMRTIMTRDWQVGISPALERLLLALRPQQELSQASQSYIATGWPTALPAAIVPWSLQMTLAIALAVLWQIPGYLTYSAWTTIGPLGPTSVQYVALDSPMAWTYSPASYTGKQATAIVPGPEGLEVEAGGILQLDVGSDVSRDFALVTMIDDPTSNDYHVLARHALNAEGTVTLPVDWIGPLYVRLESVSLGLRVIDTTIVNIYSELDPSPTLQWVATDVQTNLDVDEAWQGKVVVRDNHGLMAAGLVVADSHGASVSEIIVELPMDQDTGLYAMQQTEYAIRVVPSRWLDTLKTGIWSITPVGLDNNPVGEAGYGDPVTIEVTSRYDRHGDVLAALFDLFAMSLGYLADRWDGHRVPVEALKDIEAAYAAIKAQSNDFWSADAQDETAAAVRVLQTAIRSEDQDPMVFEDATLRLMQARQTEQKSVVSDRMGDVERSQQDLMSALQNENISDEEIMQMLQELMKKMQDLAAATQDEKKPLPQQLLNKEAFQKENQKEQENSMKDLMEQLRSGSREDAMKTLSELMKNIDKMREYLQQDGSQSAMSGEGEGQPQPQAGADGTSSLDAQMQQIDNAKSAVEDALKAESEAMGKVGQGQGESSPMGSGGQGQPSQQPGGKGQPDPSRQGLRDAAQKAREALDKAESALGGNEQGEQSSEDGKFSGERDSLERAKQSWEKGQQALENGQSQPSNEPSSQGSSGMPGGKKPGTGSSPGEKDPEGEFQQHGEESMEALRDTLSQLDQRKQALERMKKKGSKSGSSNAQQDFDEETQKARSVSAAREQLFEYYRQGVPDRERKANKTYFERLAR